MVDVVVGAAIGTVIAVLAARGIVFPVYDEGANGKVEKIGKQKRPSKIKLINSDLDHGYESKVMNNSLTFFSSVRHSVSNLEEELKDGSPNHAC